MTDRESLNKIKSLLDKALEKANSEELETLPREELNVWIPPMTNGESLVSDLCAIQQYLTPELAGQMAEALEMEDSGETGMLSDEMTSEEFAHVLINAVPEIQGSEMGLQTVEVSSLD